LNSPTKAYLIYTVKYAVGLVELFSSSTSFICLCYGYENFVNLCCHSSNCIFPLWL